MKQNSIFFFGLLMVLSMCCSMLVGCQDPNENEDTKETVLTISNNTSRNFSSFTWNGVSMGGVSMGKNKKAENVEHGSGYIYFVFYPYPQNQNPGSRRSGRTQELVTIEKGETKTFVFLDNTIVLDNNSMPCTFLQYASR